ncbi:MAG: carboxypeptidase regulatory-like domain-containing protein, partial [Armatimonadetes bacterium]|nr:carboxypeptidase regulatory-like domain-containing protein [Armatimonadota bacterium]
MPGAISGTLFYYDTSEPIDDIPGIPGDEVRALGPVEASTTPDYSTGTYLILNLPPDYYQVEADLYGFSVEVAPDVLVQESSTAQQDLYLSFAGGISGTVVDKITGQPILGAVVAASHAREPYLTFGMGTTEAPSGTTFIDNLQAVDVFSRDLTYHDVVANAEGHSAELHQNVVVRPTQITQQLFGLDLSASITIEVRDWNGIPLEGVPVSVTQVSAGVGEGDIATGDTDSTGQVTFNELQAPATHVVEVLPDAAFRLASRTYNLFPEDALFDVILLQQAGHITGSVLDETSMQPISGASVYATGPEDEVERVVQTDVAGRYWMYVIYWPATFALEGMAEGYLPASGTVDVPADAEFVAPVLILS